MLQAPTEQESGLPPGLRVMPLQRNVDTRGSLTELFRAEWGVGLEPVQWNVVDSNAGVLRGVHVHVMHDDYFVLVSGRATLGLRDLRRGSTGPGITLEVDGVQPTGVVIPRGVAHGFYFTEPSVHVYSVSHYWNMADELGCHWQDPALEIPWPVGAASVSERDATAGSLAELEAELEAHQPIR